MRISISQRIALGLALIIGLLVGLIVVNGASVSAYRENALVLTNETLPQGQLLHDLETQENLVIGETLHFLISREGEHLEHRSDAIDRLNGSLSELRESGTRDRIGQEQEQDALERIDTALANVISFTDGLIARVQRGEQLDLTTTTAQIDMQAEQTDQLLEDYEAQLDVESQEVIAATQSNPLLLTQALGAVVLLVSIALFILLVRTVVQPLHTLREATLAVASGDLSRQVQANDRDEIGDLATAFNQMVLRVAEQRNALQAQVALAEATWKEAQAAQAQSAEQLATIEDQQLVIRNLSVPILPLNTSTLVMPLVGALDAERLQLVQEQALQALQKARARFLILDLTGVPIVDAPVAQGLIQVIMAARLLGAEVLIVGIRPEVAQALVGLGIDLDGLAGFSSLQSGIDHVLRYDRQFA